MSTNVDVYASFLVKCWQVMGPFDIEKLATDANYKAEFFNRVELLDDDELFAMANLVNDSIVLESKLDS
jgi:hypothetical protein